MAEIMTETAESPVRLATVRPEPGQDIVAKLTEYIYVRGQYEEINDTLWIESEGEMFPWDRVVAWQPAW